MVYDTNNSKPLDAKTSVFVVLLAFLGRLLSAPPDGIPNFIVCAIWIFCVVFITLSIYRISGRVGTEKYLRKKKGEKVDD